MVVIRLRRHNGERVETFIDISDLERTNEFPGWWRLGSNGYVVGQLSVDEPIILLHRWIMNPPGNMEIDHINHCRLDNRRQTNLRTVNRKKNAQNSKKRWNQVQSRLKPLVGSLFKASVALSSENENGVWPPPSFKRQGKRKREGLIA
jgi:hypothetical protein